MEDVPRAELRRISCGLVNGRFTSLYLKSDTGNCLVFPIVYEGLRGKGKRAGSVGDTQQRLPLAHGEIKG